MKKWPFFIFMLFISMSYTANAVTELARKKYPYQLLTEDYGILNEKDLAIYGSGTPATPRPFCEKNINSNNYWQCFPRDNISIIFRDTGSSSEDFGWRDTIAELEIKIWIKHGVYHEYGMSRVETFSDYQKILNRWHYLMKKEKYVCLAGHFVDKNTRIENGISQEVHEWIFDKIKTKKGCNSYFSNSCN